MVNSDPEIADEESILKEKLKKFELIIFILSLDPIDLIVFNK